MRLVDGAGAGRERLFPALRSSPSITGAHSNGFHATKSIAKMYLLDPRTLQVSHGRTDFGVGIVFALPFRPHKSFYFIQTFSASWG